MNIEEAKKMLNSGGGNHFFIPSIGKKLLFKEYTTGLQKVLSRIAVSNQDQYTSDMVMLGLFDDMLLEGTHEYKSGHLTIVDMVAFIAQLKKIADNTNILRFSIKCECGEVSEFSIDLDKMMENCKKYEFKQFVVKSDFDNKNYEIGLKDASWLDLVILKKSIYEIYNNFNGLEQQFQIYYILNKICMYIKNIKINGDEIKDENGQSFDKWEVPERIKFFDLLNPKITIDEKSPDSLLHIITDNFNDKQLSSFIFNGTFIDKNCKSCNVNMEDVFTYDNFFSL